MSYTADDFAIAIERSGDIAAGALNDPSVELNARLHSVMMSFLANSELPASSENLARLGLAIAAGFEAFLEGLIDANVER